MRLFLKNFNRLILFIFAAAVASVVIIPILYTIFGAFKSNTEFLTSGKLLPENWDFGNFIYAWNTVNFPKYTMNSIIVAVFAVTSHTLLSAMTAYVFSRRCQKCKLFRVIRLVYLSSMFLALGPTTLYPIFKLLNDLHMTGSYAGLIFISSGISVAHIILMEGFLKGLGTSYDEAAYIDGCSFFMIFWRIVLPLIRPVIAVVALLAFVVCWNGYMMPMILTMGRPELRTLTVAIVELRTDGTNATQWPIIMSGASISIVPMLVVYLCANKQFVQGLTLGGVKA